MPGGGAGGGSGSSSDDDDEISKLSKYLDEAEGDAVEEAVLNFAPANLGDADSADEEPLTDEEAAALEWRYLPKPAARQDALLEKIKASSKKKQKFMLQQLLSGDTLAKEYLAEVKEEERDFKKQNEDQPFGGFRMKIVDINRTCKGTRAGGMWRFSCMVVVGNGQGVLGFGSGKAGDVNSAVAKAHARAMRNLTVVHRYRQSTVYGPAVSKFGKVTVYVYPKGQGHGLKASYLMYDICRLAGIRDIGIKVHGSRNPRNSVKALFNAFAMIRDPREVAAEQGMVVRELAVGKFHLPISAHVHS